MIDIGLNRQKPLPLDFEKYFVQQQQQFNIGFFIDFMAAENLGNGF